MIEKKLYCDLCKSTQEDWCFFLLYKSYKSSKPPAYGFFSTVSSTEADYHVCQNCIKKFDWKAEDRETINNR